MPNIPESRRPGLYGIPILHTHLEEWVQLWMPVRPLRDNGSWFSQNVWRRPKLWLQNRIDEVRDAWVSPPIVAVKILPRQNWDATTGEVAWFRRELIGHRFFVGVAL
jgi:hypothetical protein